VRRIIRFIKRDSGINVPEFFTSKELDTIQLGRTLVGRKNRTDQPFSSSQFHSTMEKPGRDIHPGRPVKNSNGFPEFSSKFSIPISPVLVAVLSPNRGKRNTTLFRRWILYCKFHIIIALVTGKK